MFGEPTEDSRFTVTGPTINPEYLETYYSMNIIDAIDFAVWWLDSSDDPYYVIIHSPDGDVVLTQTVLKKMYYSEVEASGGTISEGVVGIGISFTPELGFNTTMSIIEPFHRIV